MRSKVSFCGLLLILVLFNWMIASKERSWADGSIVYLELAPVDPRSLMQGDYMTLRYKLLDSVTYTEGEQNTVHAQVGPDRVVTSLGAHSSADSVPLKIERRGGLPSIGAETFFFQEGSGDAYAKAKYGELRVNSDGQAMLTGLLDEKLQPIRP